MKGSFVDGLVDNDEKIASAKKAYSIQDKSAKPNTLFMIKMVEKPYPFLGCTYLHTPRVGWEGGLSARNCLLIIVI